MKYFRKFATLLPRLENRDSKKPPRSVGAPGFVLIHGKLMIDEEAGGRTGREDGGKIERGKRRDRRRVDGPKYPDAAGRRGQRQGSACLPAAFVGSQTGTRNAWLTGDSGRLKRLKKWGLSGWAICGAEIQLQTHNVVPWWISRGAEVHTGETWTGSYGKQAAAAGRVPAPQPQDCAHDQGQKLRFTTLCKYLFLIGCLQILHTWPSYVR